MQQAEAAGIATGEGTAFHFTTQAGGGNGSTGACSVSVSTSFTSINTFMYDIWFDPKNLGG